MADDREPDAQLPEPLGDDALSDEWVAHWAQDWRYQPKHDRWLHWNGNTWEEDELNGKYDLARKLTREALSWQASAALTPGGRRALNSAKQAGNIVVILRYRPEIAVRHDHFDRDPWALATPAGVVNLRDGSMHASAREQYCSRACNVSPEVGDPELWLKCLDEWFGGDAELLRYIQCLCGYWLTGTTKEKQFAFLFGRGDTGKSVFVSTIMHVMGTYAQGASMDTFTETMHEAHPEAIAVMQGARLITAPETEQGRKFKQSLIKQMTGDDAMRARHMYGKSFEFRSNAKICIYGNHQPHVRSIDEAFRRRLHIIPMPHHVPPERQDKGLEEKLRAEAGKILSWMIAGCLEWHAIGGLPIPAVIVKAVDEYAAMQDSFGAFCDECLETGAGFVSNKDLYRVYSKYCEENGSDKTSAKTMFEAMRAKGFEATKMTGTRGFRGARLRIPAMESGDVEI